MAWTTVAGPGCPLWISDFCRGSTDVACERGSGTRLCGVRRGLVTATTTFSLPVVGDTSFGVGPQGPKTYPFGALSPLTSSHGLICQAVSFARVSCAQVLDRTEAVIDVSIVNDRISLYYSWRTPSGRTGEWLSFAEAQHRVPHLLGKFVTTRTWALFRSDAAYHAFWKAGFWKMFRVGSRYNRFE